MVRTDLITAVIFDMDGLMFDTERISTPAWQKAGADLGYTIPESLILSTVGVGGSETRAIHMNHFGPAYPYAEINERKKENLREHLDRHGMPCKPGLVELLDYLDEIKMPAAIATSSARPVVSLYLEKAGLTDRFAHVICGDEVTHSKPAPDIFLAAARNLGMSPGECLVLEDSENGIRAASAAGAIPVLVPDLREVPLAVRKLAFLEFETLHEVRDYLSGRQG
jgi:HAD superfamily hydrolase (TIGR01509 family)